MNMFTLDPEVFVRGLTDNPEIYALGKEVRARLVSILNSLT